MSLPPLAGEATRQPPRDVKVTPLLLDPFPQLKLWDFEKPTLIFQTGVNHKAGLETSTPKDQGN